MRAVELNGFGGPEVMEWTETVDPEVRPGEVLIEVIAAGVNRADVMQRRGFYPPPADASSVPGLECSGTIVALGDGVRDWRVGDRVCALLAGGGYAERVAVPATQVLPIPEGLDPVAAAGLPEVAVTVWSNLVMTAGLRSGELVLIHGGGGGIGTCAIQVAKRLGARVAVTAGSDEKLAKCAELGADLLINYKTQDFVAEVAAFDGADVILDNMGAKYLERNVEALAAHGRLVVIGMQGGVSGTLNLAALLGKWGTVHATNVRNRPRAGAGSKAELVAAVREQLWPMVAAGEVVPVISAELPVTEAGRAHELLDSPETFGKVVLRIRD
ncbi:putative quinone oxidoreductase [Nocardia neocaledoniensis NBRC 108232]|uniref:Putative PIG3 family NAD(P)H quinone oxidoreductase n=1 Tax=Nocardia neocaledoniensis TaxID=236511 RepID=A0A317NMH5_9NOCA|nr:NAD(P)H-quinone oxidoreductase [Nocardia neocaledoniensis]PWV76519.1 putative PIG3 family NAD(P)H quinone oxidoreductase [Nocardia neocaledoniensis]GEM29353.1 putative quinone oxidoreductase [Nocardia neocaledoniensis NBRC 108232]